MMEMEPAGRFSGPLVGRAGRYRLACTYGPVGWIAMVLVDEKLRRLRHWRRRCARAQTFLDERAGMRSVASTPRHLASRFMCGLGFRAEYFPRALTAECRQRATELETPDVEPFRVEFIEAVLDLDRRVGGRIGRSSCASLLTERPENVRLVHGRNGLAGYMARDLWRTRACSARAWETPCRDAVTGRRPMAHPEKRLIDVPVGRQEAELSANGLTVQRQLLGVGARRAHRGADPAIWASSGPEKG